MLCWGKLTKLFSVKVFFSQYIFSGPTELGFRPGAKETKLNRVLCTRGMTSAFRAKQESLLSLAKSQASQRKSYPRAEGCATDNEKKTFGAPQIEFRL